MLTYNKADIREEVRKYFTNCFKLFEGPYLIFPSSIHTAADVPLSDRKPTRHWIDFALATSSKLVDAKLTPASAVTLSGFQDLP